MEVRLLLGVILSFITGKTSALDYRTAYACEGSQIHVSCEDGYRIHLVRANYGRFSISICNDHGTLDWSVDCTSHRSYYVIHERCNLMSSCRVSATSEIFTDPCPGTYKYLEVQYQCKLESLSTSKSSSSIVTSSSTSTTRPPIIIPLTKSTLLTTTIEPYTTPYAPEPSTAHFPPIIIHLPTNESLFILKSTASSALLNKVDHCHPVQSRNLSWDWTRAGTEAIQKCPGGTSGEARWRCGINPIQWIPDTPNLSECRSLWVDNLRNRVDSGDSVVNIAAELSVMTNRKPLYAGDIRHTTKILQHLVTKMEDRMKDIADDKQQHQLLQELLESASDVTNNLLEISSPWEELSSREKKDIASTLLEALEHSSWLLASAHESTFHYHKSLQNLVLSIQVLEAWTVSQVRFPSREDIRSAWMPIEDCIDLPIHSLLGSTTNDVVKVIFVSYNNVKDFLGTVSSNNYRVLNNSSLIINSRILSASTGGYTTKFPEPVTITFKVLQEENVTNPKCVYWNINARLWSEEGCRLKKSNKTHAVCECDHLTNFALLMEYKVLQNTTGHNDSPKTILFISCAIAIVFFLLTAIILQLLRSCSTDCSSIQKHLCVCLILAESVFMGSTGQTEITCSIFAGLLHFLLQDILLWLFFSAFQLYLFLIETSQSRRMCYYYIVVYGLSMLIVSISAFSNPSSYGTSEYCFLQFDKHFIFSFVCPAVICIMGAVIFLIVTLYQTCCSSDRINKENIQIKAIRIQNRNSWIVILSSLCSWMFLLLYMGYKIPLLAYLFSVWNCIQGLAIFTLFALHNKEVKDAYRKWKDRSLNRRKTSTSQLQASNTSSSYNMEISNLQASSTVSSSPHSLGSSPEFQLGTFHRSDLFHTTRSPIYDNREQLVS